jgi:hypothetical protein
MHYEKSKYIMEQLIFNAEDLFEEIPGDPDNVILKFPPEVIAQTGWKEGDSLDIKLENGALVISKHG